MGRPTTDGPGVPTATVHFLVHPEMAEVVAYARELGWLERGYSVLSIPWVEMHYTTDGWEQYTPEQWAERVVDAIEADSDTLGPGGKSALGKLSGFRHIPNL